MLFTDPSVQHIQELLLFCLCYVIPLHSYIQIGNLVTLGSVLSAVSLFPYRGGHHIQWVLPVIISVSCLLPCLAAVMLVWPLCFPTYALASGLKIYVSFKVSLIFVWFSLG